MPSDRVQSHDHSFFETSLRQERVESPQPREVTVPPIPLESSRAGATPMPQPSTSAPASASPPSPTTSASLDDNGETSTIEPVTIQFLPIAWTPIPPSWKPSFVDGKIRLSSPDSSDPSGFKLRTDVLIKLTTDEEGETAVLHKRKPSSVLQPTTSRVSTATLVDTAETLLRVPAINIEEPPEPLRIANTSGISLPEQYFFPLSGEEKFLDIPSLLEKAQDAKGVQHKRTFLPAFPVKLLGHRAPQNLTDFLWRDPSDKQVPYQLREPDHKLWAAEAASRQNLSHHLATTTTASLLKEWLSRLATNFESFTGDQLDDILKGCATVAEGLAHMTAQNIQASARACAEARLAARTAAARDFSGPTLRGLVRAAPLSTSLFSQEATDKIVASQPPVINVTTSGAKASAFPQKNVPRKPSTSKQPRPHHQPPHQTPRQPFRPQRMGPPFQHRQQHIRNRQVPNRNKPRPQ